MNIIKEFKNFLPITPQQKLALEEQILSDGRILNPLIIGRYKSNNDNDEFLIDGHNRYEIAIKHNLPYEVSKPLYFESEEEVYTWMFNHQKKRRDWNDYQRFEATAIWERKLLEIGKQKLIDTGGRPKKGKSKSDKASPHNTRKIIAKELGWGEAQIARAKRIRKEAPPEIIERVRTGKISINRAYEETRQYLEQVKRDTSSQGNRSVKLPKGIDFRFGDFNSVLADIPDNSVDLFLTDPPYKRKFLHTWSDLSAFAEKKLKPSGFLIAYSGQYHLTEVRNRLEKKLLSYWELCMLQNNANEIVPQRSIICRWKPILVYQKKPKFDLAKPIYDVIDGGKREKNCHPWQQSSQGVKKLIELFSKEGDLICDPFVGGGTVPKMCKEMNRQFIGAEIDEQSYNISKNSINGKVVGTRKSDSIAEYVSDYPVLRKPSDKVISLRNPLRKAA